MMGMEVISLFFGTFEECSPGPPCVFSGDRTLFMICDAVSRKRQKALEPRDLLFQPTGASAIRHYNPKQFGCSVKVFFCPQIESEALK